MSSTPEPHAVDATDAHLPVPAGDGCLEILTDRLRMSPGIVAIEADFTDSRITVRYQPSQVSTEQLNEIADDVGALFAQRVTHCERRETAGICAECALRIGQVPREHADAVRPIADHGKVGVSRRLVPADSAELVRPLERAKPWVRMTAEQEEHLAEGRTMASLTIACLVLLATGLVLERTAVPALITDLVFGASAISGSWFALRSTFEALAKGRFDVNLLMILAAAGAAAIGHVPEAAVLMFLFSLSNTLEVYTMGRTRRALHALLRLRPTTALVRRGEREIEVEAEEVVVGERVIVKPGTGIPVDGIILSGASLVDQSTLTGESIPVAKQAGDRVFAGTINQQGALEVRSARMSGDTTLARIVQLVQQAQEEKSSTEEAAQWVGRYYTIVVMIASGLMIALPPLLHGPGHFQETFYRAMTLLVVASPCALVIATPATILSAIANAAKHGVLFKGGRFIEALGRVKAVAFDKTGTLTQGRFEVTDVIGLDGVRDDDVLAWAAGAEKRSQHPLAQAVVRAAEEKGLTFTPAESLQTHLGKGLVASVEGVAVEIGTPELFESLGIAVPAAAVEAVRALNAEARTAMIVHRAGRWGVIAAADRIRPTSAKVVAELRRAGVERVILISGDSPNTVKAIAARSGVDEHRGGLLPEDKVNEVAALEARLGAVAMVGDGVNDAPALARASVGIAMGGVGSDAAMESADVVLMSDDLTALPYALRLSRKARSIVTQNLVIAVGVMFVLVLLVFFGRYTPLGTLKLPVAVSGHEGSTVVVILNGLRLLGERRPKL